MHLEQLKSIPNQLSRNLNEAVINLTGFRNESPDFGWHSFLTFRVLEEFALNRTSHRTIVEGRLPAAGASILATNHVHGQRDALKMFRLGRLSGRPIRAFAKASLLDPNYKEPEEVKKQYGEQDEPTDQDPMYLQRFRAFILRGFDFISTTRGGPVPPVNPIKEGFKTLNNGQILGIAIEGTRRADGSIHNPLDGVAMIAEKRPSVPIIPIAFSGPPNGKELLRVGTPITVGEMEKDPRFNLQLDHRTAITLFTSDRIAELLPEVPQNRWFTNHREKFISERMNLDTTKIRKTT